LLQEFATCQRQLAWIWFMVAHATALP
jgi:hypothetical protein